MLRLIRVSFHINDMLTELVLWTPAPEICNHWVIQQRTNSCHQCLILSASLGRAFFLSFPGSWLFGLLHVSTLQSFTPSVVLCSLDSVISCLLTVLVHSTSSSPVFAVLAWCWEACDEGKGEEKSESRTSEHFQGCLSDSGSGWHSASKISRLWVQGDELSLRTDGQEVGKTGVRAW